MGVQYRQLILDRGEELLINDDVVTAALRAMTFAEQVGISAEDVAHCSLVATPVPIYRRGQRFTTAKPSMMWHPLLWLPESVGLRLRLRQPDGTVVVEDDTQWLVRVALELQASGLYNPEQGWVDVLGLYGIDPDDEVDRARIEQWLLGDPDPVLDDIDLARSFGLGVGTWAVYSAQEVIQGLMPSQWLRSASSILEHLVSQPEHFGSLREFAQIAFEYLPEEFAAPIRTAADSEQLRTALERVIAVYVPEPERIAV